MSGESLRVLRDAGAASALKPMRRRILESLKEPGSAATVARRLELPRQKVNYHLRALEREGLLELIEERKKGNCVERVVRATARSYLIDPAALGSLASDPDAIADRFSAAYLVAVTARTVRDVALLRERASAAGKSLATFTLQSEVRFANAEARRAFAEEVTAAIAGAVARHHDATTPGGRRYRLVLAAHPFLAEGSAAPRTPGDEPSRTKKGDSR